MDMIVGGPYSKEEDDYFNQFTLPQYKREQEKYMEEYPVDTGSFELKLKAIAIGSILAISIFLCLTFSIPINRNIECIPFKVLFLVVAIFVSVEYGEMVYGDTRE